MTVIKGEHPDLWTHGKLTVTVDLSINDVTKELAEQFSSADLAAIVIELLSNLDDTYYRQIKDWME